MRGYFGHLHFLVQEILTQSKVKMDILETVCAGHGSPGLGNQCYVVSSIFFRNGAKLQGLTEPVQNHCNTSDVI